LPFSSFKRNFLNEIRLIQRQRTGVHKFRGPDRRLTAAPNNIAS
jgi:hypothetical protein